MNLTAPEESFYKKYVCKNARQAAPGDADEVANVAELLLSQQGAFITGADFFD